MSKWTKRIPHTGDECPVDGEEVVRVAIGDVFLPAEIRAKHRYWPRITHYKRLKANVEAEERAKHLADDLDSLKDRAPNRRGPFVITDADLGIDNAPGEIENPQDQMERASRIGAAFRTSKFSTKFGGNGKMSDADQKAQEREAIEATEKLASQSPDGIIRDGHEPTPIITGPGEYKTRDGQKATILNETPINGEWFGSVGDIKWRHLWGNNGRYWNIPERLSDLDIIGPLEEPKPVKPDPREWRNLYENSAGELLMTPAWYPNEEIAREHASSDFEAHIGTVHLARATEAGPKEWIAIYKADDGSLYKSGLPASREGIERCNSLCANFIGALKLSHTMEGEA